MYLLLTLYNILFYIMFNCLTDGIILKFLLILINISVPYHQALTETDLQKMKDYQALNPNTPEGLVNKV